MENTDGTAYYKVDKYSGMDVETSVHILMPTSPFTRDNKIHIKTFNRHLGLTNDKIFESKEKAESFANKYMKEHNVC